MRKVRICASDIGVNSNENLGFAPPVLWLYVIDCAPNFQQVLPPLLIIVQHLSFVYFSQALSSAIQIFLKDAVCNYKL